MAPATPAPNKPALRVLAPLVEVEVAVWVPEAVAFVVLPAADPEGAAPDEAAGAADEAAETVPLVVPGAAPMMVK